MQLYDYQREMMERIEVAFKSQRSVMVQMPTGTGKTCLLASVVFGEIVKHKEANVWIVAHRRELVEQIEGTLDKFHLMPHEDDTFAKWGPMQPNEENPDSSPLENRCARVKVMSIQWLSRHYKELTDAPSLIVIDEAHHAVARTYAEVMTAYPQAKKLGLTATPCRLRRGGFTALFDVLLTSWQVKKFIADGWLSLYDYLSIRPDSDDQRRVLGLTKRGADGDFSLKEMSEMLDVKPSIERLCHTILQYAPAKKGITYAIDIAHAEHIAEEYRRRGIRAVAISSKTPAEERRNIIERFRRTSLTSTSSSNRLNEGIQVLVNVDLFGEGFDCPDVEFIQLARPTLSLAKYLQQVGRGMRVFEGKKYCLILDNVGLYRLFGLPSDDRDWQALFVGNKIGKGDVAQAEVRCHEARSLLSERTTVTADAQTELITVMTHDGQRQNLEAAYGYRLQTSDAGLMGVVDKDGREVLPCLYNKIELKAYGFARLSSRRKFDRQQPWIDLRNGIRFATRPRVERKGFLEFSTIDGKRFYPRVQTHLMDEQCYVTKGMLSYGLEAGLRFKNFYISPSQPDRLYSLKEKVDDQELWADEHGLLAWRSGWEATLHPLNFEEWTTKKQVWEEEAKRFEQEKQQYIRYFKPRLPIADLKGRNFLSDYEEPQCLRIARQTGNFCQVFYRKHWLDKWESLGSYAKVFPSAYGIRVVQSRNGRYLVRTSLFKPMEMPETEYEYAELQDHALLYFTEKGRGYWVYLENKVCFTQQPELVAIGFLNFFRIGEVYMECTPCSRAAYRRGDIKLRGDVCFLGSREVVVNTDYGLRRFSIEQQGLGGRHFVLKEMDDANTNFYDMYCDGTEKPVLSRRLKGYETVKRL